MGLVRMKDRLRVFDAQSISHRLTHRTIRFEEGQGEETRPSSQATFHFVNWSTIAEMIRAEPECPIPSQSVFASESYASAELYPLSDRSCFQKLEGVKPSLTTVRPLRLIIRVPWRSQTTTQKHGALTPKPHSPSHTHTRISHGRRRLVPLHVRHARQCAHQRGALAPTAGAAELT